MNLQVKAIEESDLDAVIDIENQSHIHPWSRSVFRDCLRVSYICDMFTLDKVIVVYGVMSIAAGESHIFNVCVNIEYRQQGYGNKMMQHLLQIAKDKNANIAFLEVRPSNTVAVSLYKKIGFETSGIRKDYYPTENGREDALIMTLNI